MVMAKHKLALDHVETHFSVSNYDDARALPNHPACCLVHYAYGSSRFNKRDVDVNICIQSREFWTLPDDDGTIAGCIRRQFVEAGRFFELN